MYKSKDTFWVQVVRESWITQEALLNLVMPETMCLDLVFLLDHAGQVIPSSKKVCCSLFLW